MLLAISYFRNENLTETNRILIEIQEDNIELSTMLAAIATFINQRDSQLDSQLDSQTTQYLFQSIDKEREYRLQYVQSSKLARTQIYDKSILELDNKILQKNLEIQQFQLTEEKNQSKLAYLTIAIIVLLFISLFFYLAT